MPKKLKESDLTREFLYECFEYNKETGELRWKYRPRNHFNSDRGMKTANTQSAGKVAGWTHTSSNPGKRKYMEVSISGTSFLIHRIIWIMMTGKLPPVTIDHIDRDATNNRWENLRDGSGSVNHRNRSTRVDNSSGHRGVSFDSRSGRWVVRISDPTGRRVYLGSFDTAEEAINKRKEVEENEEYEYTAQ